MTSNPSVDPWQLLLWGRVFTEMFALFQSSKEMFSLYVSVYKSRPPSGKGPCYWWVTQLAHPESPVGWHCAILSPRDYSDLKRLLCLLNVQSSKQQVVFSKNARPLMTEKSRFQRIHLTSYERYIYFPLFFHVFHLSSSCFSLTWFRVRKQDYATTAFSFLCSHAWC